MNLFKSLLFLEGYITDPRVLGDDGLGPSYGNKLASQRAFRDGFAEPGFARKETADEACSVGGCA